MSKKQALIISGPTACGKNDLAMQIANFKDIAIINADSLQIYQGLQTLSAQPTLEEQKQIKHYLYSHLTFNEQCSVGIWLKLAKEAILDAVKNNKLPVIVGGSGMYISSLVEGINKIPEIDRQNRQKAQDLYEEIGHDNFKEKLFNLTEENLLDKQRLIRAYEVFLQTKKPISFWRKKEKEQILPDFEFIHLNLNPNRDILYQNCDLRFKRMLQNGAIKEIKKLRSKKINPDLQITKTLGFYEICDFLDGKISQEEAIKIASQKTRNYAKRQLTYFRNQLRHKHIFANGKEALDYLIENFIYNS